MDQSNLIKLAQQGDSEAISQLLSQSLNKNNISVSKCTLKDDCLQLMLSAMTAPPQEKIVNFLRQWVQNLNINSVNKVKVYSKEIGEDFPAWHEEFNLEFKAQPNLHELAQKGDIDAIEKLIIQWLNLKDVKLKASLKEQKLNILILLNYVPNADFIVNKLKQELINLNIENCHVVKVYAQKIGEDFPEWHQEFKVKVEEVSEELVTKTQNNPINQDLNLIKAETSNQLTTTENQSSLLNKAKLGDLTAIEGVLNYLLKSDRIFAKVNLSNQYLQITIVGERIPEQEKQVKLITNFVKQLNLNFAEKLQIVAWRKGGSFCAWSEQINLKAPPDTNNLWKAITETASDVGKVVSSKMSDFQQSNVGNEITKTASFVGGNLGQATQGVGQFVSGKMSEFQQSNSVDSNLDRQNIPNTNLTNYNNSSELQNITKNHNHYLQYINKQERYAILKIILWLSFADENLSEEEIKNILEIALSFGIENYNPQQELKNLPKEINPILQYLSSHESKQYLLKLLVHFCFCDGEYSASERLALYEIAIGLGESENLVAEVESEYIKQVSIVLQSNPQLLSNINHQTIQPKQDINDGKALKVAGIVAGGALAVGITGGMAIPVIGGIIGTTLFGLTGAAATSSGLAAIAGGSLAAGGLGTAGGSAIITTIASLGGAGQALKSGLNLYGDLEEFNFIPISPNRYACHRLICIHGFLQQGKSPQEEWRAVINYDHQSDLWSLSWESKTLLDFGNTLFNIGSKFTTSGLMGFIGKSALKNAGGLLALPATALSALKIIDNPWFVAKNRAEKTGKVLGEAIAQLPYPVSLLGYSLGSRVIAYALEYLQKEGHYGKVFDVYLMAGAVSKKHYTFSSVDLDSVVVNNIFNCYSQFDEVLSYVYRTAELGDEPIGLSPINHQKVTNLDVSNISPHHGDYPNKLDQILELCRQETPPTQFKNRSKKTKVKLNDAIKVIEILKTVPGITKADPRDFPRAKPYVLLPDGSILKTWTNPAGVWHVFMGDPNDNMIFGGYVGWIHTDGLKRILERIYQEYKPY